MRVLQRFSMRVTLSKPCSSALKLPEKFFVLPRHSSFVFLKPHETKKRKETFTEGSTQVSFRDRICLMCPADNDSRKHHTPARHLFGLRENGCAPWKQPAVHQRGHHQHPCGLRWREAVSVPGGRIEGVEASMGGTSDRHELGDPPLFCGPDDPQLRVRAA